MRKATELQMAEQPIHNHQHCIPNIDLEKIVLEQSNVYSNHHGLSLELTPPKMYKKIKIQISTN